MPDNSERRKRQKATDIRVIVGNPPYSAGQKDENDNAANVSYPELDEKIRATYAARSNATLQRKLYDSYIRAIRWGSDRIGETGGVMAYVSGSGWIERGFADGMRMCLAEEFSNLYIFRLRGDIRKNMLSKGRAGEGGNVFGSGSMTGVAISIFVKNPHAEKAGLIKIFDIGDNLSEQQKLLTIRELGSLNSIGNGWSEVVPDSHGDWIDQRDQGFEAFIKIGDKKDKSAIKLFENYSLGIATNRDVWCYNASYEILDENIRGLVDFYMAEMARKKAAGFSGDVSSFVDGDPSKINWTHNLKNDLERGNSLQFNDGRIVVCSYRPFTKVWLYHSRRLNERVYQIPKIYPSDRISNLVIHTSGAGARSGFSVLMTASIPDIQHHDNGQCFPLNVCNSQAPPR